MREAYKELMEHVAVSDAMRRRILQNLQDADIRHRARRSRTIVFRRWAAAACLALLIAGAAVLPKVLQLASPSLPSGVQNPTSNLIELSSLDALSDAVGFPVEEVTAPPFDVSEIRYAVYMEQLAQVTYLGDDQVLTFRKAAGTEDPSGDYTVYPDVQSMTVGSWIVELRGTDGVYQLAVWQADGYSYSAQLSSGCTAEAWADILQSIR